MRLGFYAPRRSSFVVIGPVAHEAARRGHTVVFVRSSTSLSHDQWTNEEATSRWPTSTSEHITNFSGQWLIGELLPPHQTRRCHLDSWLDSLGRPYADNADFTHRTIRHGLIPTDGLLDVPQRHPTDLLWFPPKTMIPGIPQRMIRYLMVTLIAMALKKLARREHRRLIVKTRAKMRLPWMVRQVADIVIGDHVLYPWASLSALSTAALAIVHQSAAGFEAVAAHVPCVSIRLPQRHLRGYGTYTLMQAPVASPYGWPGVIESLNVENAIRWLDHWDARMRCDLRARAAYIDTWFGGRVQGTSAWLLDQLASR